MLEGTIYSVDDVSDLLGIPRPTLYRYLREYSIPHLRQGGRIRIPEDSFDSIREARDLHKEGLGTESVRRQLREGGGPDTDELDRRLSSLHDSLEDLRSDLRSKPATTTGEVALSPALRTILARQSLMLNAMFNLTGMVENLLLSNSRPRKRSPQAFEEDLAAPLTIPAEDRTQIPGAVITEPVPMQRTEAPPPTLPAQPEARKSFGSLGRRRRRGALVLLSALLLTLALVALLPAFGEDRITAIDQPATRDDDPQKTPNEQPAAAAGDGQGDGQGDAPASDGDADDGDADDVAANESGSTDTAASGSGSGVPDVAGRPLDEAAGEISAAGYTVAAIRSEPGPEDPGTVTGTEPSAGTEAPLDTAVVLTTSAGAAGAASTTASASASSTASASAPASPAP